MGNCGDQLVFGANDQVTAESVSKGLGKRTGRYKTESRTIEFMGLHRRTKVEQLRERDLITQEVRQMPGDKMVADGHGRSVDRQFISDTGASDLKPILDQS